MKIAHFIGSLYHKGGTSHYVIALARLQIAAGEEVFVFEVNPSAAIAGELHPILVQDETELFARCESLGVDILHYHMGPWKKPPAFLPVVYTVHEHSPHCISGGLFLKRQNAPCPRSYHLPGCLYGHFHDRCGSIRPAKFLTNLARLKSQMQILPGGTVICVGAFLKDRMVASGYPAAEIFVVPNFVEPNCEPAPMQASDVPEFLYLGRLEKLKGVDWLLRSFAAVSPPAILNICGEGNEAAALQALAGELGLADRVRFRGWIDDAGKQAMLAKARAVIITSIWPEPFGLAAIEAGAAARPVICSNAGELPFIVANGRNGLVVPIGAQAELTAAIDRLAKDFAGAESLGLNNRQEFLNRYTGSLHKQMIDDVYSREIAKVDGLI